jgi:hypothetical protein
MWAQQRYALQPSPCSRRIGQNLALASVRGIRFAVGQYYQWDWHVAYPDRAVQDSNPHSFLADLCSPTDSLAYTAMSRGMATRQGDNSQPSKALLARHIKFIDAYLDTLDRTATEPGARADAARAGLTNTVGWLCWFRGGEIFTNRGD